MNEIKVLLIEATKCSGCRLCEKYCPTGAIRVSKGKARIDYFKCNNCYGCTSICPNHAIKKIKRSSEITSSNNRFRGLYNKLNDIEEKLSSIKSDLDRIESKK